MKPNRGNSSRHETPPWQPRATPSSNGRPIEKTLVPYNGFMSWTAYWPNEQLCNVPQQTVIGGNPNRVLRSTFFQCFVDVRLGKGRVSPEPDLLAQFLQPLNLGSRSCFQSS